MTAKCHSRDPFEIDEAVRNGRLTVAYDLNVDFHDSLGAVTSNLIADSGVIREKDDRMEVFGKWSVVTQDSTRLDTDFLRWNPKRHKIESESFVKFTRPHRYHDRMGMEADPDLGRLKILSQVSGSVSEPPSNLILCKSQNVRRPLFSGVVLVYCHLQRGSWNDG